MIHETSPEIAFLIAKSGNFQAGPILGDAGLNCYIKNHSSTRFNSEQAINKGAIMEFEWTGPISKEGYDGAYGKENILYDQQPHRAIIFVKTTKYLKLSSITLKSGFSYSKLISLPSNPKWVDIFNLEKWRVWLASHKREWINKHCELIDNEIKAFLKTKPSIKITYPPNCIYKNLIENDDL